MKIFNILFNYKKSAHDNQILGVERAFIDYAKYLTLNGNEVFSVGKPKMVYSEHVRQVGSHYFELSAFGQGDFFSIFRLAHLFAKYQADVAICHSGRALFFARLARFFSRKKFPIIAIDHGIKPKKFLKADFVLTVNSHFSRELIAAGKPADRALVIPNMIAVPKDFTPLVKQKFRKPIRLGSLGRLYPEKFFEKTLQAMAILRERGIESTYVIGGVGPMEAPLNKMAQEFGLENHFKILGWTDAKREFFDSIDIFVLPSLAETFGIVLLEAMLYSTPLVSSNSWGPDDVIENEVNGLKVSKDDAEKMPALLADAIERLIKNEEFAHAMAARAFKGFFKNYTADIVGKRLHEICVMAVEKGRE